jgi:DNA-binding GntR family transcriptional regulator
MPTSATAPLYELIYRALRDNLAGGRLPPGLVVHETGVARVFGTSRVPAAAALTRLWDEGLLRDFEGRGYLVDGKGDTPPVRIGLIEAGLELPEAFRKGEIVRNRGERIYPEVEHTVASCLAHGRFMLNESALAAHYGVSRAIAHEVLTKLERAGIIARDRNQRWYAGPLTADHIRDHFQMRWLLEPEALIQAAPGIRRRELETRRDRVSKIRDRLPSSEVLERIERDLHIDIVDRCENAVLLATVRRSQLILIATHSTFRRHQHLGEITTMASEHLAILDHLLAGSVEAAAKALEAHLRRSLAPNIELLQVLGPLPATALPPYLVPDG